MHLVSIFIGLPKRYTFDFGYDRWHYNFLPQFLYLCMELWVWCAQFGLFTLFFDLSVNFFRTCTPVIYSEVKKLKSCSIFSFVITFSRQAIFFEYLILDYWNLFSMWLLSFFNYILTCNLFDRPNILIQSFDK